MSEPTQLPNAVVTGMAVHSDRATDHDGAEHAVVYVSFQFLIGSEEHVANQTFVMHSLDAKELRAMMKNPATITGQEATQ